MRVKAIGGLNNNGPCGLIDLNLSHQGIALFERIRRVKGCGLVGCPGLAL